MIVDTTHIFISSFSKVIYECHDSQYLIFGWLRRVSEWVGEMVLSQKLHEAFKGTVERITAPRTVSALKEKGVLSITEFIVAGDNLVSKCPTWSWSVPISIFNQIKSTPALFMHSSFVFFFFWLVGNQASKARWSHIYLRKSSSSSLEMVKKKKKHHPKI